MTERVYPQASPPRSSCGDGKEAPSPGTYVIQIPKDQVYRVPPPENAARYKNLARGQKRRRCGSPCCCCLCWLLGLIALFLILIAVAAGIFSLVVKPESPNYSIDNISIKGLNISTPISQDLIISPEINVTVRAENPNNKIGICYEPNSQISVFYTNLSLASGSLPVFCQPKNNVTVFHTLLKGGRLDLSRNFHKQLVDAQNRKNVLLTVKLKVPVKIKVGSVKTWTIKVKVSCEVTVDRLTGRPKIVKKDCSYGVDLW